MCISGNNVMRISENNAMCISGNNVMCTSENNAMCISGNNDGVDISLIAKQNPDINFTVK